MPNLADLLTHSAAARPDHVAIRLDGLELTYRELDAATAQVAGLLRAKGVGPGDRVAVMLPNVVQFAVCYYGALRAGAVVVPMNVLLKEREVAFYLRDSGANVLFGWQSSPPRRTPAPNSPKPRSCSSSRASSSSARALRACG